MSLFLASQNTALDARDAQNTAGWGIAQLVTAAVLGSVAFVALFAAIIVKIMTGRKSKKMLAELENATAELGTQQEHVLSLEEKVSQRDEYILSNVVVDPAAYSATSPEVWLKPSHLVKRGNGPFGVGNNDEDSDDNESARSVTDVVEGTLRSPTPMSAVPVQPGDIKTVTLQPKRPQRPKIVVTVEKPSSEDSNPNKDGGQEFQTQIDRYWGTV